MARRPLDLPMTQIHLDFHTSPLIPDVGADFDADRLADTFAEAHVGQVTIFAKCHHGMSYYPTKVGRPHPSLSFDLMGAQLAALHARGIRAPAYISVGYDEAAWQEDPSLEAVTREGHLRPPMKAGWHLLCLARTDYLDAVLAQAEEVVASYPVDGLFFDIMQAPSPACYCPVCLDRMHEDGIDPADAAAAARWQHGIIREACAHLAQAGKGIRRDLGVFFNSCFSLAARDLVPYDTHIDVESLPTGGWGYTHFPVMGRFARTFGKTMVGMTARFHHHWGDVGGLKPQAALEQECFHALMLGGKANIGDHLPPRGRIQPTVYDRIGAVFGQVMARAPWCEDATPVVQVGVLAVPEDEHVRRMPAPVAGAARALAEAGFLFDVIDIEARFANYEVLVLPDTVRLDTALARKVKAYLAKGGKVLATAWSGLAPEKAAFALDAWPVSYAEPARFTQPYLLLGKELAGVAPEMEHALYLPGPEVRAAKGAEVLARLGDPYFSRTYRTFSGHEEVAMAKRTRRPAVVASDAVAYAQAPLFTAYGKTAYPVYRDVLAALLDRLLETRNLVTSLPTTGRATLLEQNGRRVVHLMHYVPERRADGMDLIEDRLPLSDVEVDVAFGRKPKRVYLAPQDRDVAYDAADGRVTATVPVVDGHQMLVIE